MRSRQSFADTLRKGRKRNLSANQKRAFPRQPCETVQKTSSTCRVAIVVGTSESAEKSNKTQYKNISSYPSSRSAEEGSMLLFQTASVYIFSLQGRSFEYQTETTLIISSGQPSTVGEEYERRWRSGRVQTEKFIKTQLLCVLNTTKSAHTHTHKREEKRWCHAYQTTG